MTSELTLSFSYFHSIPIHSPSPSFSYLQVSLPTIHSIGSKKQRFRGLQFRTVKSNVDANDYESSDFERRPRDSEAGKSENHQRRPLKSNETLERLRRYGVSGLLSYGLLNTAYYLTTFLVVWFFVAPAPGRMGYLAAVERFVKVMAMVWAGSQVTKLIRAGGALALAPLVDKALSWFTVKFKFESQGKAFAAIAGFCFGLAFLIFLIVTLLSA
ncbi:hypothetical protein Leryth_022189 [Lithospermum erythrorhizon]|nr:hypothetical protein Leryth_022189 [Lithospermum erythrorhizon]